VLSGQNTDLHFDDGLLKLLSEERAEDLKQHERRMEALESCPGTLRDGERRFIVHHA
jgi:hypothetical protein